MGLKYSKGVKNGRPFNNNIDNSAAVILQESEPTLTKEEEDLLKDTWVELKNDISKVGVITFVSLFETHPEVQESFMPFKDVSTTELEYNAILRSHALRVMGTVDKCISRLGSKDKLVELMTELGKRHQNYTVKPEYIDLMGPQFISSIKPHLGSKWTDAHEVAWSNMFNLMCYHMKRGMLADI